jgi:hypothetical protein
MLTPSIGFKTSYASYGLDAAGAGSDRCPNGVPSGEAKVPDLVPYRSIEAPGFNVVTSGSNSNPRLGG